MTMGVLLIHGFSGGSYEVQPFADYIEMETSWTVCVPTLSGHGDVLSLKNYTAENWLMDAEIAYKKLAKEVDRVYVVGFSMGGLIALYIALRYKVDKLVLLSAAAKYISVGQLMQDVKSMMKDALQGHLADNELFQRYRHKLKHVPYKSTLQFMRIVKTVQPYYHLIKVPVCIVQGKCDGIVPHTAAKYLYEQMGSDEKQLFFSENGKHHICYSDDVDEWFQKALHFLEDKKASIKEEEIPL